ncbi:MAG: transglycosylase SLT domain-containing protein [Lentisphaeria bacterium]|nr:transglycosylase SLT domain-containing protein [Lentisphaeria bacterium]
MLFRSWLSPLPLCIVLAGIGVFGHLSRVSARRRGTMTATRYDREIRRAAQRYMPVGWDWRLFKAMIRQESNFDPGATSGAGARGLCQMMPQTARELGVSPAKLSSADVSIDAGARYLRQLWDKWSELEDRPPEWRRTLFTIASYNAGYARMRRAVKVAGKGANWRRVAPHAPEETQRHIQSIREVHYPACRQLHSAPGAHGVSNVYVRRTRKLRLWRRRRSARTGRPAV